MPSFNNIKDLQRHIQTKSGMQTVFGAPQIKIALKQAAELLEKLLLEELEDYYDSYDPVVYERTYGLLKSLRVSPITQVGKQLQISVYFDRDSATHPSIFGGEPGYTAKLINDGWEWSDKTIDIHRLSHYEGFHFIEKALSRFESANKWGFKVIKRDVNK